MWWLTWIQYLFTLCCCRRDVPGALGGLQCTASHAVSVDNSYCIGLLQTPCTRHSSKTVKYLFNLSFWIIGTHFFKLITVLKKRTASAGLPPVLWKKPYLPFTEWQRSAGTCWKLKSSSDLFLIYTRYFYIATNVNIKWKPATKSKTCTF